MSLFIDERHALYGCWLANHARRQGATVEVVHDDDGNATNRIRLCFVVRDDPRFIELVVPYPPEEWGAGR